ncbi:aldo/keto reductase [Flavisolibacter ginsengisoli]|jgi:aryl-alcohol dehydrogenase-like predicted oxidoreductase|uniref:Aldo/keto reductase family protein n=1 Tax=Flavisolibacter ginsengisoli DSM 18119 TaxID=1121884 RepID=A0A1M5E2T1_9BACT|nr:aldo/keto reductase [Flavisolibacter ginsengisoli]SHF73381.1 Aldo/keto reductase family protein [Flavisolibacter ginsengisoli DSM 18119]
MRRIELVKGVFSSPIGFGCAPIMGAVDAKKAKRSLDCAFDHGINHLDLARSYGYGEAEKFVGKWLKGKRNKIVLASKFGITANWKAKLFKTAKPIVRLSLSKLKGWKSLNGDLKPGSSISERFHSRINLNAREMENSLNKSLKALDTEYLDYFFIHEPLETISQYEDLIATAKLLKSKGKIKGFGIAYLYSQEDLHSEYIDQFEVLQFNTSPGMIAYDEIITKRGMQPNVIFSPLRGGNAQLKPELKLKKLISDFPNSVVLCSMFTEEHIRANASLIEKMV